MVRGYDAPGGLFYPGEATRIPGTGTRVYVLVNVSLEKSWRCGLGIGDYEKQVVGFASSTEYQVYKNDAVKIHDICLLRRTCPMVHGATVISGYDIIRASYYFSHLGPGAHRKKSS